MLHQTCGYESIINKTRPTIGGLGKSKEVRCRHATLRRVYDLYEKEPQDQAPTACITSYTGLTLRELTCGFTHLFMHGTHDSAFCGNLQSLSEGFHTVDSIHNIRPKPPGGFSYCLTSTFHVAACTRRSFYSSRILIFTPRPCKYPTQCIAMHYSPIQVRVESSPSASHLLYMAAHALRARKLYPPPLSILYTSVCVYIYYNFYSNSKLSSFSKYR
jgi:hypothetical protein